MKLSLRDLNLNEQRVLIRVDFNVPLTEGGVVRDDARIRLALPSIEYIIGQKGKLVLISHLGRPQGKKNPRLSLKPVATHLEKLLKRPVLMASDCIGPDVEKQVSRLRGGDAILLENLRFHEGEEFPSKDPSFVQRLAALGDVYVNDAFGTAHRIHASTTLLARYFPQKNALGFLMEKEISFLSKLLLNPKIPFYAILGGAKVESKIGVLSALSEKINAICIGGGMAFTFLKSRGVSIGDSLCEDHHLETARRFLSLCTEKGIRVLLPGDVTIAREFSNESEKKVVSVEEGIPVGWRGMDIGPSTVEAWSVFLKKSATVFWNGPMGVFEFPNFSRGTCALAHRLAELESTVVVGGGDSVAAVNAEGLQNSFSHISTGGGATLEYLELGHLPGIDALSDK